MKLLYLFCLLLGQIFVIACGPPKNISLSSRAADRFGPGNNRILWPRFSGNLVIIQFCYDTVDLAVAVHPNLQAAIATWMIQLGGPPSPLTGHAIQFHTYTDILCVIHDINGRVSRNPQIPWQTVRIRLTDQYTGEGAGATAGFGVLEKDLEGENQLLLFGQNPPPVYTLAHELGHLLGMSHEHQRVDRDDYIHYDCTKVVGYAAGVECAAQKQKTAQDLCEEAQLAYTCGFEGLQAVKNAAGKSDFDPWSIMLYDSASMGDATCQQNPTIEACHMVKYNRVVPGEMELIQRNTKPSDLDVAWVREHYPYRPVGQ